jgi:tripartite-type tricarboxylate transporter receptor subunit TctC
LFAPAKTPPEILKAMNDGMIAILAEPAVKARLAPLGIEAMSSTPEELGAKAAAETRLWGPLIKAPNIRGD